MNFISPSISPRVHQHSLPMNKNTISLPVLYRPHRELIDQLLLIDKEKTKQKLKENYFKKDISHLKDKKSTLPPSEFPTENLSTSILDIFKLAYGNVDLKIPQNLIKALSSTNENNQKFMISHGKKLGHLSPVHEIAAPTGRQEAVNLMAWIENVENKYTDLFEQVLKSPGFTDKDSLLKLWKSIYIVGFKEIIRQVGVQCSERGILIQKLLNEYEKVHDFYMFKHEFDLTRLEKEHDLKMKENLAVSLEEIAFLQAKVDRLEREREKWTHNKAEIVVKTKELISYLEKLRKYEDQVKKVRGKSSYFDAYVEFINSVATEDANDLASNSVSEKLKDEIAGLIKSLNQVKSEILKKKEKLVVLDDEICEKEIVLMNLKFEIDVKEAVIKTQRKTEPKALTSTESPVTRKHYIPIYRMLSEDERSHSNAFYQILIRKSKDRLMQKAKIAQDQIFKGISAIYQRAVIQLNSYPSSELYSFPYLLYKQYVKSDNRKKSEKVLKNFLAGCLKYKELTRASMLIRLLGLGDFIEKSNFSHKTFLLYLSMFIFMQNSTVGILLIKETSSPMQYYPASRVMACLDDVKSIFSEKLNESFVEFAKNNVINDPKQVNPQGIIELEKFLEYVIEEHEKMIIEEAAQEG